MIRAFINDSKVGGEKYADVFRNVAKGENLEIVAQSEPVIKEIPRGYDIYLIHLRDIKDEEEPKRLREEQPWSEIDYIFGGGEMPNQLKEYCDRIHWVLNSGDIERILERSKSKLKIGVEK